MPYNMIPPELRERRQWVIWRSIVTDKGITKPPFQPANPHAYVDVMDPNTWGSFEEALSVMEANPSLVQGIGFVFTEQDEYFGIDLDDERKVKPEFLVQRRELAAQILNRVNTYTEISPSGQGLHFIAKGRLPVAGRRSPQLQVEVYGSGRYFTMTGQVFNGRNVITDQQEFIDQLFQAFVPQGSAEGDVQDVETYRRNDLTDEEIICLATNYHPLFAPRFTGQMGCEPGEWSDTFMAVVGVIDRFTGLVDQVERIIMNSPMVQRSPPSTAGESRAAKAQRNFKHVLGRVRQGNSGLLRFAEHGRQQVENMQRLKAERAAEAAEAIRKADETIASMSKGSASLLNAFPQLTDEHKLLTRPPGVIGEFVAACERACHYPYSKFAIPATLATLSGIVSRGFKLPGGGGINVNFILAAPSNTGKTNTMKAWERFVFEAKNCIENTLSGPSKSRIINSSTSSIQGIFDDFMEMPSTVWFVEECHAQTTDAALRDSFNMLYDCGEHGHYFSPPRSVAGRKAGADPVNNLNVSTFWTTTPSKFDVFGEDALDGFLSRVVVIRHQGPGGHLQPTWEVERVMPAHLLAVLVDRLASAKRLDETYKMSVIEAAKLITTVSTSEIEGLWWEVVQISDRIKNASLTGKLPVTYTAVSRLHLTALRISALLAVFENPYTPSVTVEQFKWAFGYLLQNLATLLSDMDTGEVGVTAAQDFDVVVREMKKLLKTEYKKASGIPKGELHRHLKRRAPFKDAVNPGEQVKRTLAQMMELGMLVEAQDHNGNKGRNPVLVCPTSDPVW
jgi:hypothetical protein